MALTSRMTFFVILLSTIFLLINFSPQYGYTYAIMFIFGVGLLFLDALVIKKGTFDFNRIQVDLDTRASTIPSDVIVGLGAALLFVGASFLAVNLLEAAATALGLLSIIELFSEITPVLANNSVLSVISFGILTPIIENFVFFGGVMEFLSDAFKVPISLRELRSYALFIVVAFIFMVFHFTAKGIPSTPTGIFTEIINDPALLVTFLFGLVSAMTVAWTRDRKGRLDLRPSIITHILINTGAVLKRLGLV